MACRLLSVPAVTSCMSMLLLFLTGFRTRLLFVVIALFRLTALRSHPTENSLAEFHLRTNVANEKRKVPYNNNNAGGFVRSHITQTYLVVVKQKFAGEVFLHICDATPLAFCSTHDGDATALELLFVPTHAVLIQCIYVCLCIYTHTHTMTNKVA